MLQAANAQLQDQLYAAQNLHQPNIIDTQALKKRLRDVNKVLLAYHVFHCYISLISLYTVSQKKVAHYI